MDIMTDGQNGFNQGNNGNPYAQPQRPQQVPQNYGQQQGNPYAQPQRPQQIPQGQQQGNPYAQPQRSQQIPQGQQQGNPYVQNQRPQQVPIQQGNPYSQGQQGQQVNMNKGSQQNYAPNSYPQQNQVNYNQQSNNQPIQGWSWGGFLLGIPMGLAHGKWIMLLTFLPIANVIMFFVAGAKMHEWCYNSGCYNSVAEYNASMRVWDKAGIICFIVSIVACVVFAILWGTIFAGIMSVLLGSVNYY